MSTTYRASDLINNEALTETKQQRNFWEFYFADGSIQFETLTDLNASSK